MSELALGTVAGVGDQVDLGEGGPGIMASDACESHGLEIASLSDATITALRAFPPREASVRNPVVVKLVSATITHKSDVGGVALDLRNDQDVREAYRGLEDRLTALGWRDRMQGALVQPMLREGLEAIVGMTHDASFGPLIMFGLGGVNVELLKDVAFRVHPLTDRDARELVRSVRGFPLLGGRRRGCLVVDARIAVRA